MYKLILFCLFISASLNAQISEEWKRFYNGPGQVEDEGIKIIADTFGNSYAACYFGSDVHITLIKYDVNGNQIWLRNYEDADSQYESAADMKFDNTGNIIIAGYVERGSTSDILTLKIDPVSGNEIWRANTNTPFLSESPSAICIDNIGNICITGYIYEQNDYDIITLKYSSSGSLIFNRRFNGSLNKKDFATSIATDNSQNTYVAGYANFSDNESDYILLKYGPGGNILWGRYYDSGLNNFDFASTVMVDNSNNVIVSGNNDTYVSGDISTLKYNSDGSLLWQKNYTKSSNSYEVAQRMKIDEFDNIYICGLSDDNSDHSQILIKYNSNGVQQLILDGRADRYSIQVFFTIDEQRNIYLIRSRNTTGSTIDTVRYMNITKFDSSGIKLSDTIYRNTESVYNLKDAFVDNAGNLYLTGSTLLFGETTFKDVTSLKIDLTGNFYWQRSVRGHGIGDDFATSVILKNGSLYVCGSGNFGSYSSYANLKYRPNGELVWENNFNRYPGKNDFAQASTIDYQGNIITTGYTILSTNNTDFVTVKYDSNGVLKWYRDYSGAGNGIDQPKGITTDEGGSIYVTGYVTNSSSGQDWVTVKYNADGNQLWVSQYNGGASGTDNANAIALDHENNVFVCGSVNESASGADAALIKYDNSGNQLWVKKITGAGNFTDEFRKIKVDDAGNVYVSGIIYSETSKDDYLIMKFDNSGNELWQRTYNGTGNNFDRVNAMSVRGDKICVTGESLGTGTLFDFVTIEYDSAGNQLWAASYNGSINRSDKALAIATDSTGNVFVTGESSVTASNIDMITLKYDPSGNQQWLLHYGSTGNGTDRPAGIAVNEKEEVYVTATAYSQANNQDILTLKYSQSTGISEPVFIVPSEFNLYNNFPNPFNPTTSIQFDIPVDSKVQLKIYDITGREVHTLVNEIRKAGHYTESFDGTNLASGVYIYRLVSGSIVKSRMMVLIK